MNRKVSLKPKKSPTKQNFVLKLFITGNTPQSIRAIINIKRICESHFKDRYELEIIDIYKNPSIAKKEQIIAAPTLIKVYPLPIRRLLGDLSDEDKVLTGLGHRLIRVKREE